MTRREHPLWVWSLATTVIGAVAFLVLAAVFIPWHPYPGPRVVPAPATSFFTSAQIDRAEAYTSQARWWSYGSLVVSLLVLLGLAFTARGRRCTARLRGPWPVRVIEAVLVVDVAVRLLTLPFALLLHREQRHYGLSTEGWGGFARDLLINELVAVITTTLALVALLAVVRRWERAWPMIAGLSLGVLVLAGSFVYPLVVEPLFNHFTPLPDGQLRTAILQVAAEEHVHIGDVLVADASRRTTTLNAYVSGFGGTRRVVLYDTTVRDLPQDETLSVVAHELGHARHDDVLHGSLIGAAGAMFGVGLLGLIASRRRGNGLHDPATVPFVLALVAVGTLLTSPIENALSRQIETRADVAALATTHDPTAFIKLQQQLATSSLADPTPPAWAQFWFGSHPTALARIAVAQRLGEDR